MECRLVLNPKYGNNLEVILDETPRSNLLKNNKIAGAVYSDMEYNIFIIFEEEIKEIKVYINDKLEDCIYDENKIILKNDKYQNKRIFMNYFGYVSFTLNIETDTGSYEFYSDYLDIAIRKNISSDIVRKMVSYIIENSQKYLFKDSSNVEDFLDVKKSRIKNMSTEISILENILFEYESNFKFFRTNSKYKICNNYIVDDFEKLKEIKKETIQYIISNSQYLMPVNYFTHIKYNKLNLQPKKVLVNRTKLDYDIYENQVILSFLKYIYNYLADKFINIETEFNSTQTYSIRPNYISSYKEIYKEINTDLYNYTKKIQQISKKVQQMYFMYSKVLKCREVNIINVPVPTRIFTEVQHYRRIYKVIVEWFKGGNYNLQNEKMILTLLEVDKIYEYYILFKINNYISKNGFYLNKCSKFDYKLNINQKYKNTEYENTFLFKRKDYTLIVYYQPVIYFERVSYDNGIGLFRNNNIGFGSGNSNYYTPDYVIKICRDSFSEFIILDAKWSDKESVINYSFKSIIYKYIFSISTISDNDKINKVWAINGKQKPINEKQKMDKKNYIYNFYNSKFRDRNNQLKPSAQILTLHPDVDEVMQGELLEDLFSELEE